MLRAWRWRGQDGGRHMLRAAAPIAGAGPGLLAQAAAVRIFFQTLPSFLQEYLKRTAWPETRSPTT